MPLALGASLGRGLVNLTFLYVSITITCLIAGMIQLVMGPAARLACKTAQLLRHGLHVLSRRIANASVHTAGNIAPLRGVCNIICIIAWFYTLRVPSHSGGETTKTHKRANIYNLNAAVGDDAGPVDP